MRACASGWRDGEVAEIGVVPGLLYGGMAQNDDAGLAASESVKKDLTVRMAELHI